jgi:hypothetical protein
MRSTVFGGSVSRRGLGLLAGVALLFSVLVPRPVPAQQVPGGVALETLVKSSLMTFNDANLTGNYTVFHARLSKPFRDQFSPDRLKQAFISFSQQKIDIDIISTMKPVLTEEPRIDNRGALLVRGYFETAPNRVTFTLDFVQSEGEWKLINIHVKVKPPGE